MGSLTVNNDSTYGGIGHSGTDAITDNNYKGNKTMATYYFKAGTGEPFTDNAVTGDDAVARGQAVKTTSAPASVESWRMKFNFTTNSVDVYEDGKTNADAVDC